MLRIRCGLVVLKRLMMRNVVGLRLPVAARMRRPALRSLLFRARGLEPALKKTPSHVASGEQMAVEETPLGRLEEYVKLYQAIGPHLLTGQLDMFGYDGCLAMLLGMRVPWNNCDIR